MYSQDASIGSEAWPAVVRQVPLSGHVRPLRRFVGSGPISEFCNHVCDVGFYPQERTLRGGSGMSEKCHLQPSEGFDKLRQLLALAALEPGQLGK